MPCTQLGETKTVKICERKEWRNTDSVSTGDKPRDLDLDLGSNPTPATFR